MDTTDPTLTRTDLARAWITALRDRFRTIVLGTTSADGEPEASVAGAILATDGSFRIYVSGLAAHTRNLVTSGRASVLLAEDEATTAQPLARRRLTFACRVDVLGRDHPEYAGSLQALRTKMGPAFDLIAPLGDFQLIRLVPQRGRLVAGFGETYDVDPQDWARITPPVRPRG